MSQITMKDVLSLYSNIGLKTNLFGRLRFAIAPFWQVVEKLPKKGNILEVGCGYGFLTNLIALTRPACFVLGIDINHQRIRQAQKSAEGRSNIAFSVHDVSKKSLPKKSFDAIICFDLLHHLSHHSQEQIIKQSSHQLKPGGMLIIKDIDRSPCLKYWWNFLHDKIVTKGGRLYFHTSHQWLSLLRLFGFEVKKPIFPKKGLLYPHVLIIANKKQKTKKNT